jgi:hypothetical protein
MRFEMGLACLVLVVPACSSSSSPSSPSDGGSGADAVSEGATPPEAEAGGNDASNSEDAGDADDGGPTVCNTLVNAGQPVTATQVAEVAPAFQGGTVVDGTYTLTSQTIYTGPGGATGPSTTTLTTTISIQGSTFQVSKDTSPPTSTYMFAPTGTTYVATGECPDLVGNIVGSFTAMATTFVVSLEAPGDDGGAPTTVDTFTKQ